MRYFAYGSNMNRAHMQRLCPGANCVGKFQLPGFQLVFKYHADIMPADRSTVHGGLWEITETHQKFLDIYEGYPRYYKKYYHDDVMFYRMSDPSEAVEPPSQQYLKTVIQGYIDFGLKREDFEESLGLHHLDTSRIALEDHLGVSRTELEQLFARGAH